MKLLKLLFGLILIVYSNCLSAQQTVGLFLFDSLSYNGYTLFAPMRSTTTYLIDNCGEQVHSWPSAHKPNVAAYLLENGNLLRMGQTFNLGFLGGGGNCSNIEMIDWNGNVIWNYDFSSDTTCLHHDVEYLPNGNILAIARGSSYFSRSNSSW